MGVEVEANKDNIKITSEMDGDKALNVEEKPDDSVKNDAKPKEDNNLATPNVPIDAMVDWPAAKKIRTFYFIKVRSYEDPELRAKIEQADKDLQRKNQTRTQILDLVKAKRAEKSNLKSQLQPYIAERKKYSEAMYEKVKEIKPLRDDLNKLRDANNAARERGMGLCSSEEVLNDLIKSLHYQIQHESNTLNEEKKLLKEIKQLEATRDKVITNAALRGELEGSKNQKAAIQDRVKLLGGNMDEVRKEREAVDRNINRIDEELKIVNENLSSLEADLNAAIERRDKAFQTLSSLRKARDEMNGCFYQNRSLLNNANELAAKKDIPGLEALSNSEVEKFMSKWNTSKVARDDYERRILNSLNYRQLSRDGRMRSPDEKPIFIETPQSAKVEILSTKVAPKQSATVSAKPPVLEDVVPNDNVTKTKETKKSAKSVDKENVESREVEEIGGISLEARKPETVDPEKLKQIKREEEIAKNKLALERKRKAAEKAVAKAAAKAMKEAEKKLKKEEKKVKKKVGATESDSISEAKTDSEEAEKEADTKLNENPTPEASKGTARYRKPIQPKAKSQLPRAILKKKKPQSYMYWAIPAAVLAVMLVILTGLYSYGKI